MAMFERVFELPARTLTRWKNGDFSSSALALLRIVKTYPWMIEIAENKYKSPFSKCAIYTSSQQYKSEIPIHSNIEQQVTETSAGSSNIIQVNFKNDDKKIAMQK